MATRSLHSIYLFLLDMDTQVNVGGLRNVLQAYKEIGTIEKIIYTSSIFALGSTDGDVADESQIHHGKFFCTEYEKSKAVSDKIALEAAAEGVAIVPVYPGVVYGPGKVTTGNSVARLIIERFSGRLPGYIGKGNDKFSFCHVDDVVEGHIAALNKARPRFNIPLSIIEAYGWISVFISRITGKPPLISPPTVDILRHQWAYSCEKAKTELDYSPGSLEEGLGEYRTESEWKPTDFLLEIIACFALRFLCYCYAEAIGYLGGRLCHALLKTGHSVRAFVRPTSDLSSLPPPTDGGGLELVYGDVTDYQSLLAACSGCRVIFHAAALVNVGGLRNVLQAYKEIGTVEKIIYTSSFFALGSTDGDVADESQIHHGKFFCTEYEKSKAVSDKIALEAAAEGVAIVPVYPGVVYGPGKVTAGNSVARLIIERFSGRLPGYIGKGNDKFSFCHVDDVVEGHIAALNKGQPGERYLLTGENASFVDVFDKAAALTETARPRFNIPLSIIEAYGWISVFISRITGKLPLISPPTVDILRHQWAYSCEKAKTELDYSPRSLEEGLGEVLPWLKSLGLIKY
ncbi:hypothetical protein RHGRI_016239 [Rhododendron griersonianum]|uniref:NAD-dependent epimerase/dehydratase domain-containing protein n=1 Tax=Rhododendron griersonianum TaxID=479676 RepID=A0AAV6JSM6_9ERIC|nr:hypothetical protein RHGRI_016239 [Rhododendron griersonianum]